MSTQQDIDNLYQGDDLEFLVADYVDPREHHELPADLAVLVDDEGREESLGAEDNIPVHQRPWTKVIAVLVLTTVGLSGAFAFFMGGQPKSSPQVAKVPTASGDRTNFTVNADDAAKTEIALGTQRRAFEGSATPSPTPTGVASPAPTPSVVISRPTPLPTVTVAPSPVATVKPTPVATAVPVQPKPVAVAPTVAKPQPVAQTPKQPQPQRVARIVPLPPSTQPARQTTLPSRPALAIAPQPPASIKPIVPKAQTVAKTSVPAAPSPQPVAKVTVPVAKPQPIARIVAPNPQPIAKAIAPASIPTTAPLSPEEQWLKLSEANRFGGRVTDVVATNIIPPGAAAPLTGVGNDVTPLSTENRTINIGSSNPAEVDETLIPVPTNEIPSPAPSHESGLQTISFSNEPEAANKDSLKPLITEFGVVNGSGKTRSYSIPPGTRFAGTLLTPVQAAGSSQTDQLLAIQLDQPVLDQDGQVAIAPHKTQIIFRWSLTDGWIQATSESLVIDGKSVSVAGAFVLQGNDGQPLVASTYQPGADEVAAADRTSFLLGAAKGVGEVLTAPDTSVVTNGLGGVTSTSTAKRDILGAVMRGGADPVLQGLTQRNLQRSQAIQSRKPIWYLQPGARVHIYTTTPLTFTK